MLARRSSPGLALGAGLLCLTFAAGTAMAADWPQWRGPERSGMSAEKGLAASWPAGGPPLLWRSAGLGGGYSSLAVAGGSIYTLGDLADGQHLIAKSAEDGRELWKVNIGPPHVSEYGGSRSTPTVDGDRVYALSSEGRLVCLEAKSGKLLWSKSLSQDFGGAVMTVGGGMHWKWAESPLVDGERVIVTPGAAGAALVALDKLTGKEIWRTQLGELGPKGADGAAYSSVVISMAGGVRQYVQILGRGVVGVEAASGRLLWSYNKVANHVANIPTPLVDGDQVFVSTGYGTGAALLKLRKTETGVAADEVYFVAPETFQNHHGNMILVDGHVYAGTGHNKGFPACLKLADGTLAWGPVRNQGTGSAAVAWADGKLYLRYQNGLMVLAEATPKGYQELGSFAIPGVKDPSWSHPVIAGGRLYLREQDNLFVYDLKAPAKG